MRGTPPLCRSAAVALACVAALPLVSCRTGIRAAPAVGAPDAAEVERLGPMVQRTSWHPSAPPAWGDVGPSRGSVPTPAFVPAPVVAAERGGAPPSAPCAPDPCPAPRAPDPSCADDGFRAEAWARYWRPWPSGTVFITIGGEPGTATTIDLEDDLDLDAGDLPLVGLDVGTGRHRLRFAYEPLSFSGRTTLDRDVIWHGATYPAGERVDSEMSVTLYRAGWDYRLLGQEGGSALRAGVQAEAWTFEGRIEGKTSGLDERRQFTHFFPLLTVTGETRSGPWRFAASAAGGGLASDRWHLDLEATVGLRSSGRPTLGLDVGWRWTRFQFHETTNEADMTFQGPFVAATLDF